GIIIRFQYRELSEEEMKLYKDNGNDREIEQEEENGGRGRGIKQEKINEKIFERLDKDLRELFYKRSDLQHVINRMLEKQEKQPPLLLYHINRFTAKNTRDYFIHKNLRKFLMGQLDYFIKSEVLNYETLSEEKYLDKHITRAKVVKEVGEKIIDFLAQIEDFQKKLWEKKKFVIKTDYVITLDRIKEWTDEGFYREVLKKVLQNKDQLNEWERLGFGKFESEWDLVGKKLPIDTRHFDESFKWKLLERISEKVNLDDALDGLLIKSENWQALNTILNKYRGKIKTIYIDPPYNTGNDEFLYMDRYQHSSWLTMMENRLSLARGLLRDDGITIIHIDDNELANLKIMMQDIFGEDELFQVVVISNPRGRRGDKLSRTHDYILFHIPKTADVNKRELDERKSKPFLKTGKQSERETGRNCFYPIYIDKTTKTIVGAGEVPPDDYHPPQPVIESHNLIEVWPITYDGKERKWRYSRESFEEIRNSLYVKNIESGANSIYMSRESESYKTVWTDKHHNVAEYGTKLLEDMGLRYNYPKSLFTSIDCIKLSSSKDSIILDFFAGSGTTAQAVMKLNKEDGGNRKFILVEMANYFETIILPRIKKVAYSFNWKDGRPQDTDGLGVFFKYQILEQYEDTLDNLELKESKAHRDFFKDEYLIKYFLEIETKDDPHLLNISMLKDPYNYKLKVNLSEVGEPKEMAVDVIETFNYLLGLKINKLMRKEREGNIYTFVLGEREGKSVAVVWRVYSEKWTEKDYKKDRDFIEGVLKGFKPEIIYINGQHALAFESFKPDVRNIEPEFKRLMFSHEH
ncbi:MAG: site-specific DNA-methyltransferase, partial [Thermocrinis sp.]|uniref:site-specific DNA-methyltransferase n=1 Tax=Thermocrinis sp. TaxID=2024383 RepID=UPI003C07AFDE